MNELGVNVPKRAVLGYFISLLLIAAGLAVLFAIYVELRPIFEPYLESRRRGGLIVSLPFIAAFWLMIFVMTRYVTPTLLKLLGVPNIDYIGFKRASGTERIVPDYPEHRRRIVRGEDGAP